MTVPKMIEQLYEGQKIDIIMGVLEVTCFITVYSPVS